MAQTLEDKDTDKDKNEDKREPAEGQTAYTPEEANNNMPEGTKVMVIVNPASGKKAGIITTNTAGTDDVRRVLEENNIQANVVETEYPEHATKLAKSAIDEGYDIVIACGGDGTVGEVAHALIGSKVTLGILPLGSANNVARMMHVPFDLAEAGKLLRIGEIRKVDVGRCNGEYFLETAGVGLDAALFPILNHVDKGEYIHLLEVVRTLFRFRPRRLTLVLDGKIIRVRALVVLVANGPYWGYSVPLAPNAKVDDHLFDVVVFRNFSKTDFIRHVVAALLRRGALDDPKNKEERRRYTHHTKLQIYRARQVRVLTPRYRRPWPVHADAQGRGKTPARIDIVPSALKIITGPGEHFTIQRSKGTPQGKPPKHRLRS